MDPCRSLCKQRIPQFPHTSTFWVAVVKLQQTNFLQHFQAEIAVKAERAPSGKGRSRVTASGHHPEDTTFALFKNKQQKLSLFSQRNGQPIPLQPHAAVQTFTSHPINTIIFTTALMRAQRELTETNNVSSIERECSQVLSTKAAQSLSRGRGGWAGVTAAVSASPRASVKAEH